MRRYVRPGEDAHAWSPSGRWGPKRVQVEQCFATLRAEDLYTRLIRDNRAKARPGAQGSLEWSLPGRSLSCDWELRHNFVWRFGRLFLKCPRCDRRATRMYVPAADAGAACRRCWGLTYESQQRRTYRAGPGLFSPLTYAWCRADDAREARAAAAAKRYAERREIFGRTMPRRALRVASE
jgi:hypothetical protein